MKKTLSLLILFSALLFMGASQYVRAQEPTRILDIRVGAYPNKARIVIDLSKPVSFSPQILTSPSRLVVDMDQIVWDVKEKINLSTSRTALQNVRYGLYSPGKSRIVFDFAGTIAIEAAFSLPSQYEKPHRIVIDVKQTTNEWIMPTPSEQTIGHILQAKPTLKPRPVAPTLEPQPAPTVEQQPKLEQKPTLETYLSTLTQQNNSTGFLPPIRPENLMALYRRKAVIVLDAGHGGIDPGAVVAGLKEKDVVLRFTQELAQAMSKSHSFEVITTRNSDKFLKLSERVAIATQSRADLIISFHADTLAEGEASGISFFVLSDEASDEEAQELASLENKKDLLPGFDLPEDDLEISSIIIELSQKQKINSSDKLAHLLVQSLKENGVHLHKRPVRKAGFRVLKAPNTPALLVELGFLSSAKDRKNLQDAQWRQDTIESMIEGMEKWYVDTIPKASFSEKN